MLCRNSARIVITVALVTLTALVAPASLALGQETPVRVGVAMKEALETYAEDLRHPPEGPRHYDEYTLVKSYGGALIPEVEPLLLDKTVRGGAHDILVRIATYSERADDRARAVEALVRCMVVRPKYSAPGAWYVDFTSKDYSDDSRRLLKEALDVLSPKEQHNKHSIIMLAGTSGDSSLLPRLRFLDENRPTVEPDDDGRPLLWRHALRASARLGDKRAIAECVRILDALPDEEQQIRSLEDIAYIRQDEAVACIMPYLLSNKQQRSQSRDVIGLAYWIRANWILQSVLLDYPSKAPLEQQRQWMREQTKWKIRR